MLGLYFHTIYNGHATAFRARLIVLSGVRTLMFSQLRSTLLIAGLVLPATFPLAAQTASPTRVGIINAQKAVADTAEIKRAQATLEAKYKPRQQAIATLQGQMQTIQQQLSSPNQTPERDAQLRADGTQKQKELQRLTEDLQADVNNERQDILGRAGRQMADVVRKIAEQRGLDVVVDVSNTIYFKPALEITAEATADYDKTYPVK